MLSSDRARSVSESARAWASSPGRPRAPPTRGCRRCRSSSRCRRWPAGSAARARAPSRRGRGPSRPWRSRRWRRRCPAARCARPGAAGRGRRDPPSNGRSRPAGAPAQLQLQRVGDERHDGRDQHRRSRCRDTRSARSRAVRPSDTRTSSALMVERAAEPGQRPGEDGRRAELPAELHGRGDGRVPAHHAHRHHVEPGQAEEGRDEVVGNAAAEVVVDASRLATARSVTARRQRVSVGAGSLRDQRAAASTPTTQHGSTGGRPAVRRGAGRGVVPPTYPGCSAAANEAAVGNRSTGSRARTR